MKTKVAIASYFLFLLSLYIFVPTLMILFGESVNFITVAKDVFPFSLYFSGVFCLIFIIFNFLEKKFSRMGKS
jgi:hypothetical protein